MPPDDDPLARLTAEADQMAAAMRGVAEAAITLRKQLAQGGFSDHAAESMCMAWFDAFVVGAAANKEPDV